MAISHSLSVAHCYPISALACVMCTCDVWGFRLILNGPWNIEIMHEPKRIQITHLTFSMANVQFK